MKLYKQPVLQLGHDTSFCNHVYMKNDKEFLNARDCLIAF